MLITFSGLDGAGKSTLIGRLQERLQQSNRQVAVFHMNDHIGLYAYLRTVRDWLLRRDESERPMPTPLGHSRRNGIKGVLLRFREVILWNPYLRRCIYPFDLVVFMIYRIYIERMRGRVLIMDRYFYDTLVDVAEGHGQLWVRLLALVTPRPDVPIFLAITAEESFARKGEYTVEYLKRRQRDYERVFLWVDEPVILPTSRDIGCTIRALEEAVFEGRASGNETTDDITDVRTQTT